VRCGRCGNENGENNRFCGMCGAPLLVKPEAATPTERPSSEVRSEDRFDARSESGPVITGQSFLGLSTPGPAVDRPARAQDPLQPSSRNLDYLLEDEEEPKRGWGKLILVVLALALAVGFGYLHWKEGGFDWLRAGEKKPAAATVVDAGQSGDSAGTAAAPAPPAAGTAGSRDASPGGAAENAAAQGVSSQSASPPGGPSPNTSVPQATNDSGAGASSAPPAAGADSDKQSTPAEAPALPKAAVSKLTKPAAIKAAPAKPTAAKPLDAVTLGERYIYGREQRQDCDLGLRLLKTAAEQLNAKAMISLGALYSTGTCTPRDLPTAYRWFALALHMQPDNQALQDDLQNLWAKMTQPERQLAIKLSQ